MVNKRITTSVFSAIFTSAFVAVIGFGLLGWSDDLAAAKPVCGDSVCSGREDQISCPVDCGVPDVCGDNVCGISESCSSCQADCDVCPPTVCNNDGVCNDGEDCLGCGDCPGKTDGKRKNRYCCGADACDTGLCGANACSATPQCGNGIHEYNEECDGGDNCDIFCKIIPVTALVPINQFNIGDSIGEGEAANGTIGDLNHQLVWSSGYDGSDIVNSLNERFESLDGAAYTENNSTRDPALNQAVSGSVMADFATQAQRVADEAGAMPSGQVGMTTILLGANDVCADSMADMTSPAVFEAQYRAGLDVLAGASFPEGVNLQVASIPDLYWLWNAKHDDFLCRAIIWPFVPCGNLLDSPADDCSNDVSRQDPDNVDANDGPNCQRRKALHAEIRDTYNPILSDVLAEYKNDGRLENADYVDIFDVRFNSDHVNDGDCFHPSTAGHSLLAEQQWCRSRWGVNDPTCSP